MIDNFSSDMLNGTDDWSNMTESQNGFPTAHHQKIGDNLLHYDAQHQYDGYSHHFGNTVQHYDSHGFLEGHASRLGDRTIHYDSHNMISGYEQKIGNQTYHYDNHNQLISRTDAFGHTFSSSGILIGNHNKY